MNTLRILFLLFAASQCSSKERTFVGQYTTGFEWSYFIECGFKEKYWVEDSEATSEFKAKLKKEGIKFSYDLGDPNPIIWVKFIGSLSKRGEWGHMNEYPFQLTVKKYIKHGKEVENECAI